MFPAKLLLFGEYSIIHGSLALAVPFKRFRGSLTCNGSEKTKSNILPNILLYLEKEIENIPFDIDLAKMKKDVENGLFFESNIPVGYGMGSSGAVSASIYERYSLSPVSHDSNGLKLLVLMNHLSIIENFFHGTSSGIDPLVSYTKSTILTDGNCVIRRLENRDFLRDPVIKLFLIDTGRPSDTRTNVNIFKELIKKQEYFSDFKKLYIPIVNNCIDYFLQDAPKKFFSSLSQLSLYQQDIFDLMMPSEFFRHFQKGTDSGNFFLKLCGSGGGGFLLGFTPVLDETLKYFRSEGVKIIPVI